MTGTSVFPPLLMAISHVLVSQIGIVLYFVTSSDSGSLVIDCLSSNGDPDPPRLQRVFWALMEGATATALLVAGGKEGEGRQARAGSLTDKGQAIMLHFAKRSWDRTSQPISLACI